MGAAPVKHCIATKRVNQASNHANHKASKILGVATRALETVGEADDEIAFENSMSDSITDSIDKEVMQKMLSPQLSVKSLTNVMGELKNGPKQIFAGISVEERTTFAFNEMRNKLHREEVEIEKYHSALRAQKAGVKMDPKSVIIQSSGDRTFNNLPSPTR